MSNYDNDKLAATWYAFGRQDAEHNPLVDVFAFGEFYAAQRHGRGQSIQDAFVTYLASVTPQPDQDIWQVHEEFSCTSTSGYAITGLSARLACGHWSTPVHEASSNWDFPHEAQNCPEGCGWINYDQRVIDHLVKG